MNFGIKGRKMKLPKFIKKALKILIIGALTELLKKLEKLSGKKKDET